MSSHSQHRWHFFRAGGLDQVQLRTAEDLLHLGELDQTLWVALACPVRGLECDEATLRLIDSDGDGRVRVPELLAAVAWTCQRLRDPACILKGLPEIAMADLVGADLIAAAKRVLDICGESQSATINLRHLSDRAKIHADTLHNGDGIITVQEEMPPNLQKLITAISTSIGTTPDRSGREGIDSARLDAFLAAANLRLNWLEQGKKLCAETGLSEANLTSIQAIRGKLEEWFHLSALAAYDPNFLQRLSASEVTNPPLAWPDPKGRLTISTPIHPLWQIQIETLWNNVIVPLTGARSLDHSAFKGLIQKADLLLAWQHENAGAPVASISGPELQSILSDTATIETLRTLMAKDLALAGQFAALSDLERLIRYHRDLAMILRNFLCFADFYDLKRHAIFQTGTLYLDERRFDLCLSVEDPAAHAGLATLGRCFLLYCACTRHGEAKRHILAAVTQGSGTFLMVGRNGMFYDRQGRDWDAVVVKIIEAPISIRQAFWSPYTSFAKIVNEQIFQRLSGEQVTVEKNLETTAVKVTTSPTSPPNTQPKPLDFGMLAVITMAFGAISTVVLSFFALLTGMGAWLPLGLICLFLSISGPSCIIAAIKLRGRSLGPLLEASGWAINGRVRINIPLGIILTRQKHLPKGSITPLKDPFAERSLAWLWWLILAVILAAGLLFLGLWWYGKMQPIDLIRWCIPNHQVLER